MKLMQIFMVFLLLQALFHQTLPAFAGPVPGTEPSHESGREKDPWHVKARALFEHAVQTPTVIGRKKVPELAAFLAKEFKSAGIPGDDIKIMPYDETAALIVRWRAEEKPTQKPIMLMGHLDVVEAKREDWTTDPFTLVEKDGYYYGRGTIDMKEGIVATMVAVLKLKASGFKPKRDIILFYTGDEETNGRGAELGATEWKRQLGLDVEYGLNADAGGGGFTADGRPLGFYLQSAEKTYADYTFTVRNKGGHSSKPRPDNAIYQLAAALKKLEAHSFEPALNETTRAYFSIREKSETGKLGDAMRAWLKNPSNTKAADIIEADLKEVGLTRTRCVATRLAAGHANNALPQLATATINCRILPDVSPDAVKTELERIVADPNVIVTRDRHEPASLASPLRADVVAAYTEAVHARFPDAPIIPEMSTGASDARPFRRVGIPVYGVNGAWIVFPEDQRAHGRDERLPVEALDGNVDHWVRLLKILAK